LDIIAEADYVVDLGPEAGARAGRLWLWERLRRSPPRNAAARPRSCARSSRAVPSPPTSIARLPKYHAASACLSSAEQGRLV
jgi:hypothetical protein